MNFPLAEIKLIPVNLDISRARHSPQVYFRKAEWNEKLSVYRVNTNYESHFIFTRSNPLFENDRPNRSIAVRNTISHILSILIFKRKLVVSAASTEKPRDEKMRILAKIWQSGRGSLRMFVKALPGRGALRPCVATWARIKKAAATKPLASEASFGFSFRWKTTISKNFVLPVQSPIEHRDNSPPLPSLLPPS